MRIQFLFALNIALITISCSSATTAAGACLDGQCAGSNSNDVNDDEVSMVPHGTETVKPEAIKQDTKNSGWLSMLQVRHVKAEKAKTEKSNAKTSEKKLVPNMAKNGTETLELVSIQQEMKTFGGLADFRAPTWNEKVGLTTACMTIGLMLSAILLIKFAESQVQEPPETSSTPKEAANLDVVTWVSLATAFCNINFACLLPNVALSNNKQGLIQQGALIGIYALGTVVTYPLFRRIPATQAKWAITLHAIFTTIGNCSMVGALLLDSTFILFLGRLMCGMEAGVKYTSNLVVVELVGPKDRVVAAMTSRLYNSVSFALGPAVGVFPRMLIEATVPADRLALMPSMWAEAVPLVVMGIYGAVMSLSVTCCFRSDIKAPLDDSIEAPTESGQPQHQMERYAATVMFALTTANNFIVRYQRIVLEAGTLICLVHMYGFGDFASVILVLVAASLFLGRSLIICLNKFIEDEIVILKFLDKGMLITCCFLFHTHILPESLSIALLVCGCMIYYNMNSCQSGVLMTAASKVAIKNDPYLSKAALTSYLFFSNVAAYFFGPVFTFLAMYMVTSQNLMAIMLAVSSVTQTSITNYALRFVAAKENNLKKPLSDKALSGDLSGKDSTNVAILVYQFGKYDFKGVNGTWTLPKLTGINVSGFFFYSVDTLSEKDLDLMKSYGWKPILTVLHEGTPYVCSERLTSKRTKWTVSDILQRFDVVITHDCDVSANYEIAVPNLVKRLLDENTSAILQHHPKGKTVIQQMDEYLDNRPWRVSTSRENCLQWRAEIEDMMTSEKYKFDSDHYVLSNCFAYRPQDPCWQRVGQKVYEKCHLVQRDQFMIPWAVQSEGLKHSWTTKEQLISYGFRFRSQSRHLETGVFN